MKEIDKFYQSLMQDVVAMQASALDDFGVGETGERLRVCHVKVWNFYSAVRPCRTH